MTSTQPTSEVWRTALLSEASIVREAISCLDLSAVQVAIVVDDQKRLVGTLTDGDIRRGLLRGLELSSPIADIIHRDPIVVPPQWGRETVLQLMQANKVRQMPVVDEHRLVVGLHLWDDLLAPAKLPNCMVIMAGGRGQRLMPHTANCPKPMLQVGGKPILEHIIERASGAGLCRFVISLNYLGHMIEEHFSNGHKWNVEIEYLHEELPLGTAGALSLLKDPPDAPILVVNGDVLTDIRYSEILDFHCYHRAAATMAVRQHEWQHPFGVIKTNGFDIVGFEEKPLLRSLINTGIYVLEPFTLGYLQAGNFCDMPTLFERLRQADRRVIAYPMHEPWFDVGRPDDLKRVRETQKASG